jgi:hypothetical protein
MIFEGRAEEEDEEGKRHKKKNRKVPYQKETLKDSCFLPFW